MDVLHVHVGLGQFGKCFAIPVIKNLIRAKGNNYSNLVLAREKPPGTRGTCDVLRAIILNTKGKYEYKTVDQNTNLTTYSEKIHYGAIYGSNETRFNYLGKEPALHNYDGFVLTTTVGIGGLEAAADMLGKVFERLEECYQKPVFVLALENGDRVCTKDLQPKLATFFNEYETIYYHDVVVDRIACRGDKKDDDPLGKTSDEEKRYDTNILTEGYYSLIVDAAGNPLLHDFFGFGNGEGNAVAVEEGFEDYQRCKVIGLNGFHYFIAGYSFLIHDYPKAQNVRLSEIGKVVNRNGALNGYVNWAYNILCNAGIESARDVLEKNFGRITNETLKDTVGRVLSKLYGKEPIEVFREKVRQRLEEPITEYLRAQSFQNIAEWAARDPHTFHAILGPLVSLKYAAFAASSERLRGK